MSEYFFAPAGGVLAGGAPDEGGAVFGAALSLGMGATAERLLGDKILLRSELFGGIEMDLGDLEPRDEGEFAAAFRSVCRGFLDGGNLFGGFSAEISCEIPENCGLSRISAAEVLLSKIIGGLYFENSVPPQSMAFLGEFGNCAEKLISAAGGFVFGDFSKPGFLEYYCPEGFSAKLQPVLIGDVPPAEGQKKDFSLYLVAKFLGHESLSDCEEAEFLCQFPLLRQSCGEEAAFAALRFFEENRAAAELAAAAERKKPEEFLEIMRKSEADFEEHSGKVSPALKAAREFLGGEGAVKASPRGGFALALAPREKALALAEMLRAAGNICFTADIA